MNHNRDTARIARAHDALVEAEMLLDELDRLRAVLTRTTQRLTGMPGGGAKRDGMAEMLVKLGEKEQQLYRRLKQYLYESGQEERILADCKTDSMRTFVRLMYVERAGRSRIASALKVSAYYVDRMQEAVESANCMLDVDWARFDRVLRGDEAEPEEDELPFTELPEMDDLVDEA